MINELGNLAPGATTLPPQRSHAFNRPRSIPYPKSSESLYQTILKKNRSVKSCESRKHEFASVNFWTLYFEKYEIFK